MSANLLSTPSLGITDHVEDYEMKLERGLVCFQLPLSGSPLSISLNDVALTEAFNSLSRDHAGAAR